MSSSGTPSGFQTSHRPRRVDDLNTSIVGPPLTTDGTDDTRGKGKEEGERVRMRDGKLVVTVVVSAKLGRCAGRR
jgi:hypothetical protein